MQFELAFSVRTSIRISFSARSFVHFIHLKRWFTDFRDPCCFTFIHRLSNSLLYHSRHNQYVAIVIGFVSSSTNKNNLSIFLFLRMFPFSLKFCMYKKLAEVCEFHFLFGCITFLLPFHPLLFHNCIKVFFVNAVVKTTTNI